MHIVLIYLFPFSLLLGALHSYRTTHFGVPPVSFVAVYLQCQGTESELSDCYGFTEYRQYVRYCSSNYVAGVTCLCKILMILH